MHIVHKTKNTNIVIYKKIKPHLIIITSRKCGNERTGRYQHTGAEKTNHYLPHKQFPNKNKKLMKTK